MFSIWKKTGNVKCSSFRHLNGGVDELVNEDWVI